MKLLVVAIGQRQPAWADEAWADFAKRFPPEMRLELKASADETLRLSDLTLPHAFARVLLAEALYRAWSLTTGHPYHRE